MKSHCIHLTAIPNFQPHILKFSEFTMAEKNSYAEWMETMYIHTHLHITYTTLNNFMETQPVKKTYYINVISLNITNNIGFTPALLYASRDALH